MLGEGVRGGVREEERGRGLELGMEMEMGMENEMKRSEREEDTKERLGRSHYISVDRPQKNESATL